MRYAIIENEIHALEHLQKMISDLRPEWELVFTASTIESSVKNLDSTKRPDLIFMDIELDDGNSFEIFEKVKVDIPIIFTTAYDSFCLQAFKVNSLDYVLKPISMEDILFAIRKFESSLSNKIKEDKYADLIGLAVPKKVMPRILTSERDSYNYVLLSDVAWFESEDKCIFLTTNEGKKQITSFASLSDVEEIVIDDLFFRVSRSVLININSIKEVKKSFNYKLSVTCEANNRKLKISVPTAKRKDFIAWFGYGKL